MPIAWLDRARFSASNGPIPDSIVEGVEELAADAVLGGFASTGRWRRNRAPPLVPKVACTLGSFRCEGEVDWRSGLGGRRRSKMLGY